MPSDFRQRPSRKHGKAVVPLIPFNGGGKDVVKTKGGGQGHRLVYETGALRSYIDLL